MILKKIQKNFKKSYIPKTGKKCVYFFSKVRSRKKRALTLPFEIEHSNFICEQRRYRCLRISLHFFSIPSQLKVPSVQSSAIFKSKKIGDFFMRQWILQAAQVKNKKSASHIFFAISTSIQVSNQNFCSYNNNG